MKKITTLLLLLLTHLSFAQLDIVQPNDIIIVDSPFDGFATFNLTINEDQILNGNDPSTVSITYHESSMDAIAGAVPIAVPTAYNNFVSPQSIWVRVELISDPNIFQTVNFDIIVDDDLFLGQPGNLIVYEFPFDGLAQFNLTQNEDDILAGIDPSTVNITYHNSQAEANASVNPIANPSAYFNVGNPETVFVRVELGTDPNFFSTITFEIEVSDDLVNIPDANFLNALIAQGVDVNNSGNIQFFEAQSITNLSISNSNVQDLTGIEAFINLVFFYSLQNPLSNDLDFSSNHMLELLVISSNQVNSINLSSNQNLEYLDLDCPLSTLDLSNNLNLELLYLNNSDLVTLDLNHNSNLVTLALSFNQVLESVFIKNGSYEGSNSDLGSWPNSWSLNFNPSLQYVCSDEFEVDEILGYANGAYVVNSYCSSQPGGDFNTLTGTIQFDFNNDGCDSSDPVMPFIIIEAGPGPSTVTPAISSNENGVYNYYTAQPGNITLQPYLENPSYFNISPNFPLVNIPIIDNSTTTQDFCLTANGSVADAEVVIAPVISSNPGFDATYKMVYKNKGNQVLSGSVDFQYDDSVLDFLSSTTTPDSQSLGELTFNFTNLLPFESRVIEITVNVNGPTETPPVNIDDILDFTATVTIDQTEETPIDNSFEYNEVVVGSYDPNDITCLEGDVVLDTKIGEYLHYLIRFENTGTAPAQNVVVSTAINNEDYNLKSLQILDSSHDMFIRNNNAVIEFVFEDIMLPENGGQGSILLKLKTLPTLTLTDEVNLQAEIYFDFNFPIITNVANTSFENLSVLSFDGLAEIYMYPNPTAQFLNIEAQSPIQRIEIFDILGKIVTTYRSADGNMINKLDLSHLISGTYLVKVNTAEGQNIQKLVKK